MSRILSIESLLTLALRLINVSQKIIIQIGDK